MKNVQIIERCKEILAGNWRDGFTIPTDRLYPFQWNWDSGFVSLGLAQYDIDRAIQELKTLFRGQWANGMLPHILFHDETQDTYFPNYDFWDSKVNSGAPKDLYTSGITQPPVHGFVLEYLWSRNKDNPKVVEFVKYLFPKIVALHRFFYTYRDPNQEGLCFICHPWESGRDNSPLWDEALQSIDLQEGDVPLYKRRDTNIAPSDERPTSYEYDRYVYLVLLAKKYKYDGAEIAEESPFLIQDTLMNAILIRSNAGMIRLGEELSIDCAEVKEWQAKSISRFREKLWDADSGFFFGYDVRNQKHIAHKEIGSFISLFGGLCTPEMADRQAEYLQGLHESGYYLTPSFDVDSELFDAKRYWRGPVWPHMNWMIYEGLKQYAYDELAEIVRKDTLDLVGTQGFFEYFNAVKSAGAEKGYGGDSFSWSASSILDLTLQQ